jgi:AmmeMemoRadiSam system protein A
MERIQMSQELSKEDGTLLLRLARENILCELGKEKDGIKALKSEVSSLVLEENRGTFVSLHKRGDLRGCIGNIAPVKTIWDGVCDNSRHAAFNDSRFSPLKGSELSDTIIEISILTRPQVLDYKDADELLSTLRPEIDGVIIEHHNQSATFLPQVWSQLADPSDFLTHLCTKAGLSPEQWKTGDLRVSTYQVQLFEEDLQC